MKNDPFYYNENVREQALDAIDNYGGKALVEKGTVNVVYRESADRQSWSFDCKHDWTAQAETNNGRITGTGNMRTDALKDLIKKLEEYYEQ